MRILFLTQVLPYPLDAGPKVRAYHVLQHLSARHEITLVSFTRPSDPDTAISHLKTFCHDVRTVPMVRTRTADLRGLARSLLSGLPFSIARDDRAEMRRALSEVAVQGFDAIHADQLSMAEYALWAEQEAIRTRAGFRPHMVMDAHNAYYLIPSRLAAAARNPALQALLRREARLTARYEAGVYRRFDDVLTVSQPDLTSIKKLMVAPDDRQPRFINVPICVDTQTPPIPRRSDARGLLMLGGLHWPPNAEGVRWFVQDIWPLVRAQATEARLFVVGTRPPADIRALGDYAGIHEPGQAANAPVVVTGYVEDATPFIQASAALVVALRSGGGMRVKIVESLQWGLPVVSTTIGCEGIDVEHGRHALIADEPRSFAQAVVDILNSPDLASTLSDNGRRLVEEKYDWRKRYVVLDAIYAS